MPRRNLESLHRAAHADAALETYVVVANADPEFMVADLLADLMHWCAFHGRDFDTELGRAQAHYSEEIGE